MRKMPLFLFIGYMTLGFTGCNEETSGPVAYQGTYYLNGEETDGNESIVITENELQFNNYDYYLGILLPGLEGTSLDPETYKQQFHTCISAPYSYEFLEREGQYYVDVKDFDGTGFATLKIKYKEGNGNATLLISDNMPGFIICADNVSKVYGNGDAAQYALKHVSLSVPQGEFLSITGESGSGKSTLLNTILAQMQILCKTLPEYSVVRDMNCIGDVLAPRIIAEIGDVRRFKNKHALIAYAGIDAPPYQSGTFNASERKISKRGNSYLRKTGYEIM